MRRERGRLSRPVARRTVLGAFGMAISGATGMSDASSTVGPPPSAMPDALLLPAYFSPVFFPKEWARLADRRLLAVVLNVANGPGAARVPEFAVAVDAILDTGSTVIGYLDAAYGARPRAEIEAEARRYRNWYGVSDVFLDQVPTAPGFLGVFEDLCAWLRARNAGFIAFNHGAYPDPGYAEPADLLVTFEGPWSAYQHVQPPAWAMCGRASRFCHLVYDTPAEALEPALRLARQRNTGIVYVTDGAGANPWGGLARYLDQELEMIA